MNGAGGVAAGVMGDRVGVGVLILPRRSVAKAEPMLVIRLEVAESGVTLVDVASRERAE